MTVGEADNHPSVPEFSEIYENNLAYRAKLSALALNQRSHESVKLNCTVKNFNLHFMKCVIILIGLNSS